MNSFFSNSKMSTIFQRYRRAQLTTFICGRVAWISSAVPRRESGAGATLVSEKRSFEFAGNGERSSTGGGCTRGEGRRPLAGARRSAALDGRRLRRRGIDTPPPAVAAPPPPPARRRYPRVTCPPVLRANFVFTDGILYLEPW